MRHHSMGAVVSHITEYGAEGPIVYASRSLTKAGRNCQICSTTSEMIISLIKIPSNKKALKVSRI